MYVRSHHRPFALLILTFALGLAACGGGSATTAAGQPTTRPPSGHCPAAAGLPSNANDHSTITAAGSQLAITANDFFFNATCVTGVPPGGTATLTIHNAGQALHNVSIPALNIDMDVSPGQTIAIQVRMGSMPVVFFCKYHKSVGMYGALLPSVSTSHGCCCCGGCGPAPGCTATTAA
jgi:hypothetical protein